MKLSATIAATQYQAWYLVSVFIGMPPSPDAYGYGAEDSTDRRTPVLAVRVVVAAPIADEHEAHQPDAEGQGDDDAEQHRRPARRAHPVAAEIRPEPGADNDNGDHQRRRGGDTDPGRSRLRHTADLMPPAAFARHPTIAVTPAK